VTDDAFHVAEHFSGGDAEDREPAIPEPPIPLSVPLWPVPPIMSLPVYFHHKAGGMTEEVGRECSRRVLLPKLEASRALPQMLPQQDLWQRHLLAQLARHLDRALRPLQHDQILP
jgi:hypothetical protein